MSQPVLKADPSTGIFHVHWSANRRSRRHSLKTADAALARALFARWLLLDHDGPAAPNMTIGECWTIYTAKHRPVSAVVMQRRWRDLTEGVFGAMKVSDFGQGAVDRYVDLRTSGRLGRKVQAPSTRKELADVIAAMNHCAAARRFVVAKVKLPPAGAPRDRWLRDDEIKALFAAAVNDAPLHLFLNIALNTAGRVQAILDLTWDRIDFTTGVIHLDVPGREKTKKRRASVPISTSLRPVLQRAYSLHGWPMPNRTIFRDVTARSIWERLNKAVVKAGLGVAKPGTESTGVSPHVLRHTAATHMVRNGVPLAHVAAILGNTVAVVEKTYAHHCPQHLRAAVDSISGGR